MPVGNVCANVYSRFSLSISALSFVAVDRALVLQLVGQRDGLAIVVEAHQDRHVLLRPADAHLHAVDKAVEHVRGVDSPLTSLSRTAAHDASLLGTILIPYFSSNFITDAITTDAQSVSGMKPIFTSVFSGASEPPPRRRHAMQDRARSSAKRRRRPREACGAAWRRRPALRSCITGAAVRSEQFAHLRSPSLAGPDHALRKKQASLHFRKRVRSPVALSRPIALRIQKKTASLPPDPIRGRSRDAVVVSQRDRRWPRCACCLNVKFGTATIV